MQKKNARWVFKTIQIIWIIISLICFTEKVYGSSPYSPNIPTDTNNISDTNNIYDRISLITNTITNTITKY